MQQPLDKAYYLAIIMDDIYTINPLKDTTLAMILEAQNRGYTIYYILQKNLSYKNKKIYARCQQIRISNPSHSKTIDGKNWFSFEEEKDIDLSTCAMVFIRKDPPVDSHYIHTTQLLSILDTKKTLVINNPQAIRDANEKLFALHFPDCMAKTIVSANAKEIKKFIIDEQDVILKTLNSMGGDAIFRVKDNDLNINVIIETLTKNNSSMIMAQKYLPEISKGDKRIILINGEPVPYALARIPKQGETRGNLAKGGKAIGVKLSDRDKWLCSRIAPVLKKMQLWFVGLDVIGDWITEINVTSPTGVRELDKIYGINICRLLFESLEKHLKN